MRAQRLLKGLGVFGTMVGVVLLGIVVSSALLKARDDDDRSRDQKIRIGFRIAPVKLNLQGKNLELVGLGSYIVNAQGDCNGCHNSPDLGGEFAPNGVPYFGQPKIVNPDGYLGGGRDFGSFRSDMPPGAFPHIVSRNLTPDISGMPEGGHTFEEFLTIMNTGHDFDNVHPTCDMPNGSCLPPPFDGSLLQIMPWPIYAKMSRGDKRAIYEYLSAIPCISHAGTPDLPSNLYQTCPE